MKNILVCGGAGYIGSHATKTLCSQGYNVVVVDNLETGFFKAIDLKAKFYKGDIRNLEFLNDVFKKENIDCVMHFAANSLVGESMKNPLKYFNNNIYGNEILLRAMLENNVLKIVFSSTAAVYGEVLTTPILETETTIPTNPYGETKLAMEKMMKWADLAHNLKYIALRYFNVAGASECATIGESHQPETHLIPIILEVANNKRDEINVFGQDYNTPDKTCIRDYIHIQDLVDAHILAMKKLLDNSDSDVFNLGTGTGYSVLEMIEAARKVTGHTIPHKVVDRRIGDPAVLVASNEKAKKELGWNPVNSDLEKIIESAWAFHKNFPHGF